MRYPLFEFLALTVGSVSIVAAIVATLWSGRIDVETAAQVLLLVVLVGAVHRGKKGGLVTALAAILAYIAMRMPMIMRHGLSSDVVELVLVRIATYAVIGIGGGILCSRIREFLARLESTSNIDPVTQLFNQRFVTRTLRSLVLQHERYQKSFSVGLISVAGYTEAVPGPATRPALRAAATHLRDSLRLVDEIARLDDGRFVLVLPQTDKRGARIAVERVCGGVKRLLRASDQSVTVEVLSAEEDLAAIRERFGITDFEGTEAQPSRAA